MNAVPNAFEIEAKSISIYGSLIILMDKTRCAHYNINYHFVWIPKYRRKVLVSTIKADLEKFSRITSTSLFEHHQGIRLRT
jgi:hypothetical protein